MTRYCWAPKCKENSTNKTISLHSFPKILYQRQLWIKVTGRSDEPTKYSYLCSKHFRPIDFDGTAKIIKLKDDAIPSQFDTLEEQPNNVAANAAESTLVPRPMQLDDVIPSQLENIPEEQSNNVAASTAESTLVLPTTQLEDAEDVKQISILSIKGKAIKWQPKHLTQVTLEHLSSPSNRARYWSQAIQEITMLRKKVKMLQEHKRRSVKRINNFKCMMAHLDNKGLLSKDAVNTLTVSMSSLHKNIVSKNLQTNSRNKFSPELRSFALTLQFYSSKAYDYVRKTLNNGLPHPSTLRKWYHHIDGSPGFTKESFEALKVTVSENKKINKKTVCALMIDEMAIRKHLHWDGKVVHGYINYGTEMETNDFLPEAKEALVFLLNAVNAHWKIPLGYFLIAGFNGSERANLVTQCLQMLHEIDIKVLSLTFDGAASNLAMANKLGACITSEVALLKSDFSHPVLDEPVFILFDACHMLKLWRNAFGIYKILYYNNEIINYHYLELLVEFQENCELHAANKLRRRHLNWDSEKMNVRLAAQMFSNSVADALNWLEFDIKEPQFKGAASTATFCRMINNMFDLLNSRNRFVKDPSKAPISQHNIDEVKQNVTKYVAYICDLKVEDPKTKICIPITSSGRRTGLIGMILSLRSALGIYEQIEKQNLGMDYLLTYKLSQDHIETFFSAIRKQGGFNNNPSAYQLQSAYKRLLVHHEITGSKYANCVAMDSTRILHVGTSKSITESSGITTEEIQFNKVIDHDYALYCDNTAINDIVAYITGFVIRKVKKLIHCKQCSKILTLNTPDESISMLLKRKNRGNLCKPLADIVNVCKIAEQVFRGTTVLYNKEKMLMKHLIIRTIRQLNSNVFTILDDHIKEQELLSDHKYEFLKLILSIYFNIRIHHATTTASQPIKRIRKQKLKETLFKHQ